MRYGSLFSGIGGIDLGLERAGLECAWQVEADPYCRAVLAKHWPDVPRSTDVREFPPRARPEWAFAVDLIAGGFPCQDISQAGKKKGIEHGERSGLWREFARIVRVLRPRFVLVENVAALLSRDLGHVLGDLAQLGFDAEWTCLSAADIGAPHLRKRVFVVAARRPVPHAFGDVLRFEWERLGQQHRVEGAPESRRDGGEVAHTNGERFGGGRAQEAPPHGRREGGLPSEPQGSSCALADTNGGRGDVRRLEARREQPQAARPRAGSSVALPKWPPAPDDVRAWGQVPAEAQPALCGLADGLPSEMGRGRRAALKAFGNACVPDLAELIGHRVRGLAS